MDTNQTKLALEIEPILCNASESNFNSSVNKLFSLLSFETDDQVYLFSKLFAKISTIRPKSYEILSKIFALVSNSLTKEQTNDLTSNYDDLPPLYLANILKYGLTPINGIDKKITNEKKQNFIDSCQINKNPKYVKQYRFKKAEITSMLSILNDDVQYFKDLESIPKSIICPYEGSLILFPSLISAAYLGAENCFQYFLDHQMSVLVKAPNGVRIKTIADAAVAGGSMKILRTLERLHVSFDNSYIFSIQYQHIDILRWVFQKKQANFLQNSNTFLTILKQAAKSQSYIIFAWVIEHQSKPATVRKLLSESPDLSPYIPVFNL